MRLSALFVNCTLKPSPAVSNTEALARVVIGALEQDGVDCEIVRLVDLDVRPGVSSEDGAHHVISEIAGALIDVGFTVPGQAWTYWNRGPGPGKSYLEDESGREWSHTTGRTAASNLLAAARALRASPIPPPP